MAYLGLINYLWQESSCNMVGNRHRSRAICCSHDHFSDKPHGAKRSLVSGHRTEGWLRMGRVLSLDRETQAFVANTAITTIRYCDHQLLHRHTGITIVSTATTYSLSAILSIPPSELSPPTSSSATAATHCQNHQRNREYLRTTHNRRVPNHHHNNTQIVKFHRCWIPLHHWLRRQSRWQELKCGATDALVVERMPAAILRAASATAPVCILVCVCVCNHPTTSL